jgi:hypothetical protein
VKPFLTDAVEDPSLRCDGDNDDERRLWHEWSMHLGVSNRLALASKEKNQPRKFLTLGCPFVSSQSLDLASLLSLIESH